MKTTASRASAVSQTRGFGDLLYDKAGSRPSLDLDFAGTSSLRDKITGENLVDHTRASTGTYIDSEGLVKEGITNSVLHSEDFSNSAWVIGNVTKPISSVSSPIGTQAVYNIVPNTTNANNHYVYQDLTDISGVISVHVKSSGMSHVSLIAQHTSVDTSAAGASFNLTNGTLHDSDNTTGTQIIDLGNGWYRISITANNCRFFVIQPHNGLTPNHSYRYRVQYAGNGTDGVYVWGAQYESGATELGEYIKTTSTVNSAPRFTHERVETGNLLTDSTLKNPDHIKSFIRILQNQALAPDGTFSAAEMRCISSATNYMFANPTTSHIGIKDNTAYTVSIFAKKTNTDTFSIFLSEGGNKGATFNLTNKTATVYGGGQNTARITETDNGWFRCEVTNSGSPTTVTSQIRLGLQNTTFVQQAVTAGQSFYFWGFQFEEGDSASTVVPSIDTFTSRLSNATYVDSAGLVKTAALNEMLNSVAPYHHSHTSILSGVTISIPSTGPIRTNPFGNQTRVKTVVATSSKPDFTQSSGTLGVDAISNQFIRLGGGRGGLSISGNSSANVVYTFSFYVRSNSGNTLLGFNYGQELQTRINVTATSEWQRVVLTGKHQNYNYLFFDIYYLFNGAADLEFTAFQVEKGTSASDYVETAYVGDNPSDTFNTSAEARYSHDPETLTPTGLYLEPAATNLITNSNRMSSPNVGATGNTIISLNTTDVVAPDGTNTAIKFICNSDGYSYAMPYGLTWSSSISGQRLSYFIKKADYDQIRLTNTDLEWNFSTKSFINLGSNTFNESVVEYPNGWFRVSYTVPDASANNNIIGRRSCTANTTVFYIWGFQLETSSYASSYIPTSGSQVTRAADVYTSTANLTETFEPRGLLIEEARTNVWLNSEDVDSWTAGNSTVNSNSALAPDGTQTADTVTFANINDTWAIIYQGTFSGTYTWSGWIKTADNTTKDIYLSWASPDLARVHTFTATGEWQRFEAVVSPVNANVHIGNHHNLSPSSWNGGEFCIWGVQLEVGSFATSYIPTTSSSVTRSADIASISGDNFGTYRTNLIEGSENFKVSNLYLTNNNQLGSIKDYTALAPNGTYSASKLVTINGNGFGLQNFKAPITSGQTYTFSIYAKADDWSRIGVRYYDGNSYFIRFTFDLVAGQLIGTANGTFTSSDVGNGWYRLSITGVAGGNNTGANLNVECHNTAIVQSNETGTGVEGIFIWGAQFEENSTATNYIPSTDTFTSRLGDAQYVDSNGIIRTSYANRVINSETFSGWALGNASITNNATTAPDGTQTGNKWIANTTADRHRLQLNLGSDLLTYTASIYAKAGELTTISLRLGRALRDSEGVKFNLSTGAVIENGTLITSSSITPVGDGWYRLTLTHTTTYAGAQYFVISEDEVSQAASDGSSGFFIWGAQVVKGSEAGDYYKTTGTISGPPRYSHDPNPISISFQSHTGERLDMNTGSGQTSTATINIANYQLNFNNQNPNNLSVGDSVTISGDTNEHINGTHTIAHIFSLQSFRIDNISPNGTGHSQDKPVTITFEKKAHTPTGLYLEPAKTLLIRRNIDFDHSDWVVNEAALTTDSSETNPDGTSGVKVLTATAGTKSGQNSEPRVKSMLSDHNSVHRSFSVFVKKKTNRYVGFGLGGTTVHTMYLFDFDTESIGHIANKGNNTGQPNNANTVIIRGFKKYPNGWYRLFITSFEAVGNGMQVFVPKTTAHNSVMNAGNIVYDGTESVYIWGSQAENGELSSIIYGNDSYITRPADTYTSTATTVLDRDGGNKEGWFKPEGSSLYFEAGEPINSTAGNGYSFLQVDRPNTSIGWDHGFFATKRIDSNIMMIRGGLEDGSTLGSQQVTSRGKHAFTWGHPSDTRYIVTNGISSTDTKDMGTNYNILYIGYNTSWSSFDGYANTHFNRITFWNKPIENQSLINITNT